jgi:uncharacterized protein (DUF433 family)
MLAVPSELFERRTTMVSPLANITHRDPDILSGSLVFVGTRVPVRSLFDYLEGGESIDEFLGQFPSVKREAAIAVLDAAYETVAAYVVLDAVSNELSVLAPLVPALLRELASLKPKTYTLVKGT